MKALNIITAVLLLIGGVNWGLVGALDMDLVQMIFGVGTPLTKAVYASVGISALHQAYLMITKQSCCAR
ncbi:MAG: hypothetical protein K0S74_1585 [Chlamydiales bacterium]|jgi:uncharacterized membrane protein YuzA (DUF378 family)|nr:hypothetical protein [Chlamydiales bacterium]